MMIMIMIYASLGGCFASSIPHTGLAELRFKRCEASPNAVKVLELLTKAERESSNKQ